MQQKGEQMLRKKKRIEALEKRVADLEAKLAHLDQESATILLKIAQQKNEDFQKKHHSSVFSQL